MRKFSVMSMDEFLEINNEPNGEEDVDENEEVHDIEEQDQECVNPNEVGDIDKTAKVAMVKRTRGSTKCVKIHARVLEDREEITLDNEGEPIGPNDKAVSNLSYFLGTVARNSDKCPLIYTNWKGVPDKDGIWEFVLSKFIIPENGKKAVLARVNDDWRGYKAALKIKHFKPYKHVSQMLKNRPKGVPESHFRKLIDYWRNEDVQKMSAQNRKNRAQQKFNHRKGPINFARIRAKLSAKNNEPPTQAEMFVETRQNTQGKPSDEDTLDVIAHLQAENEKSKDSAVRAFRSIFGKEKAGRVRCHGRITTPTLLKKNEEIAALKQHADEKANLEGKVDVMEQEVKELKSLVKMLLQQKSSEVDLEKLATQLGGNSGNSNHLPNDEENHLEEEDA